MGGSKTTTADISDSLSHLQVPVKAHSSLVDKVILEVYNASSYDCKKRVTMAVFIHACFGGGEPTYSS